MKQLGLGLLTFVVGGILLALAWEFGIKGSIERSVRAEVRAAANDVAVAQAESAVVRVDTVWRTRLQGYPVYRDAAIAANPNNAPLRELAKKCDELMTTCQMRVEAGNNLADSLRKQVADLKVQKKIPEPRFSAFAEGLYDFVHREPVLRGGGAMRVIGPLSLTIAAEASAGMEESRQRAMAGLRFTFR